MSDSPRYVIQHHTGREPEHFDLMLQRGAILWTWQLDEPPGEVGDQALDAHKIFDHRLDYLDYEGPISGGRGECRIVEGGGLHWISVAEDRIEFELQDGESAGRYILELLDEGQSKWRLSPL